MAGSLTLTIAQVFGTIVGSASTGNLDVDFNAIKSFCNDPMSKFAAADDTGTANAYAITLSPAFLNGTFDSYGTVWFKAVNTNTGVSTLNVGPVPGTAKALKKVVSSAVIDLNVNDIIAGAIYGAVYQAALDVWILINPSGAVYQASASTQTISSALVCTGANVYNRISTLAASYTVAQTDADTLFYITGQTAAVTVTLPTTITVGTMVIIKDVGATAFAVTITGQTVNSLFVDGSNQGVTNYPLSRGETVICIGQGPNWFLISNQPRTIGNPTGGDLGAGKQNTAGGTFKNNVEYASSTVAFSSASSYSGNLYGVTRSFGTLYTNNTGHVLVVLITITSSSSIVGLTAVVAGTTILAQDNSAIATAPIGMTFMVPNGATYEVTESGTFTNGSWFEL